MGIRIIDNQVNIYDNTELVRCHMVSENNLNYNDEDKIEILKNDSGLHFILRLNTEKSDEEIKGILNKENINISALSEYSRQKKVSHDFIISYSNLDINILKKALDVLSINLIS